MIFDNLHFGKKQNNTESSAGIIRYDMVSDKGGREHNEDSVGALVLEGRSCFVLADGLGGHAKGEVASTLVKDCILEDFKADGYRADSFLDNALMRAQNELLKLQEQMGMRDEMKTTVVCLQIDGNKVRWGHCGDSRLYLFYKGKVKQRTQDHSVPQMLVNSGQIKEKEIRHHEDRNRLLRVMGTPYEKKLYECSDWIAVNHKLSFLLCSDGFWELILENEMEKLYKESVTPAIWLKQMAEIVADRGKDKESDNYSAITVWL